MSVIDPNLVAQITAQVMQALRARTETPAMVPAEIRPPVGLCVAGDKPKPTAAVVATPVSIPAAIAAPEIVSGPKPVATLLGNFITAEQIARVKTPGPIALAPGAKLTPLAKDYIRDRGIEIIALEAGGKLPAPASATNAGKPAKARAAQPVIWWCDASSPEVAAMARNFPRRMQPAQAGISRDALVRVLRDLARQVKSGQSDGGILFVSNAAKATVYAAATGVLRPVVATCARAVSEAGTLGANLLVVEFTQHAAPAMQSMLEQFIAQLGQPCPNVTKELLMLQER